MEPLSTLCNDDAWCKKITCLARALVALASAIPRLPKYCAIPESSQQALFQFIFIPLAVRNICISLLIYTEKIKLAIFRQCLQRKLNINRSVLTPCWCPKIELNYYSNVVFVSIEKHGLIIVIITIITSLLIICFIHGQQVVYYNFLNGQRPASTVLTVHLECLAKVKRAIICSLFEKKKLRSVMNWNIGYMMFLACCAGVSS